MSVSQSRSLQKDINALPLRGHQLIYKHWFKDQNLIDDPTINEGDGPDTDTDYTLFKRAKKHGYFTSMLPWPQKNNDSTLDVSLPLGTTAPVITNSSSNNPWIAQNATTKAPYVGPTNLQMDANGKLFDGGVTTLRLDPSNTLLANLTDASSATINQFRQSMLIQSLLELDARGGTRYVEMVRAHFNVQIPDYTARS